MKERKMKFSIPLFLILAVILYLQQGMAQEGKDPFMWLEEIHGIKAMEWVKARNERTTAALEKYPDFQEIYEKNLEIVNSRDRIASPNIVGDYVYNFWQDSVHERGIWRRISLEEYFKSDPDWEIVLDIDSLSEAENTLWAYKGAFMFHPKDNLCMVQLSRGGSDAVEMREFDLRTKKFIKDGFFIPEAKGFVSWIDQNTLFVMTDFGEGSMTTSGYPRIAKIWKRGTPLNEAETIFEGDSTDVSVYAFSLYTPERRYQIVRRGITFYTTEFYAYENGNLIKLDFPKDVKFDGIFKNQMLLQLKSDWEVGDEKYKQGSLISIDYDDFLNGDRNFTLIDKPGDRESIVSVSNTKDFLFVNRLNNVKGELYKYTFKNGDWASQKVEAPDFGTIQIASTDDYSNRFFFTFKNFLTPTSLFFSGKNEEIEKVKSLPAFFDASNLEVKQYEAVSKDGTSIPYFLVQSKDIQYDGDNPTLLYAYGGFEVSEQPFYSAVMGSAWFARGGVFALANLRGGGEFGPQWHLSAIKENRHKVNEDMIAVSEDLINRKITSPKRLGIMGGSNGGLLVGSVLVQRPDLYNAVVCQQPLLDMKRYNKLLAGASWMGEYGDPDKPEEWAYIKKYSPYQNVSKDKNYPKVLFMTATSDDRVHPGHARKMAAKMESLGKPVYFYENTEGGHAGTVTNQQVAYETALIYSYLWLRLEDTEIRE